MHHVRPYWEIKNRRIARKRRWYALFESYSGWLQERTPNFNYHSHHRPKGNVVYSYEDDADGIQFYCTARPKKKDAKPHNLKLVMFDRDWRFRRKRED